MAEDIVYQMSALELTASPEFISREPKAPETSSTLFPKISGKIKDFFRDYNIYTGAAATRTKMDYSNKSIKLIGTVKLHGAHADLVEYPDDKVIIQSRNVIGLSVEKDSYDTAKTLLPLAPQIVELRNRYQKHFKELNPDVEIDRNVPTIIAGEWIGSGIQKNVTITNLPKRYFVILSVSINNAWLPDEPYAHIYDEPHGFFNISRGGFFHDTLELYDTKSSMARLMVPTMEVEAQCPFGKTFGIEGRGEGIVWKAEHPLGNDARFTQPPNAQFPLCEVNQLYRSPPRVTLLA